MLTHKSVTAAAPPPPRNTRHSLTADRGDLVFAVLGGCKRVRARCRHCLPPEYVLFGEHIFYSSPFPTHRAFEPVPVNVVVEQQVAEINTSPKRIEAKKQKKKCARLSFIVAVFLHVCCATALRTFSPSPLWKRVHEGGKEKHGSHQWI